MYKQYTNNVNFLKKNFFSFFLHYNHSFKNYINMVINFIFKFLNNFNF